jgi:hypothetical protein
MHLLVAELKPMYEGLPEKDQLRLDKIYKLVMPHKTALSNTGTLRPLEVFFALAMLEVYKLNNHLQHEQYKEIRRIRKAVEDAGLLLPEETEAEEFLPGELTALLGGLVAKI